MEIDRMTLPLAAYTLAQELLIELVGSGVFTVEQAQSMLDRAIERLQPNTIPANSEASIFLGEIRDSLG